MERREFLAAATGLTAATAGCLGRSSGNTAGTETTDYDVGMSTREFKPAEIEVSAGSTVVWRNTSSHAHTVTAYDDSLPDGADYFASGGFENQTAAQQGWFDGAGGALYSGDVYEHTFEVPGEYVYFCIPHEASRMVGTVTVTE
ncbi:plastocyanin/azurin family copper-binding protein [Haloarculaceae archaeon H-GB2-1]|nr:plastocyanin/azurin family copper-binding protein [Haloarculaceae archaeon H-GB1-1]MEA5386906.1 plastocyanin/azurin family copper-binding protein [Haloarculaceae archaeon H-GB11]MEA5408388.1 plastocyanin/azurin family copper-binding protein [Haloarculaceae archaeon H-GB2-1]